VLLFWLSITALSLDLAVNLSLNGAILTASLLLPYAALWYDASTRVGDAHPLVEKLAPA